MLLTTSASLFTISKAFLKTLMHILEPRCSCKQPWQSIMSDGCSSCARELCGGLVLACMHMTQPHGLQVPEGEEEQYTKGQHLRGKDAQNAEQVQAEMVRITLSRIQGLRWCAL